MFYNQPLQTAPPPNPTLGDETQTRPSPYANTLYSLPSSLRYTPPVDTPNSIIVPLDSGFPLQGTTVTTYQPISQEEQITQRSYVYLSENQYDRTAELSSFGSHIPKPDCHRQPDFYRSGRGSTTSNHPCPTVDTYLDTAGIDPSLLHLPLPSFSHTIPTSLPPSYPGYAPLPEFSVSEDTRTSAGTYVLNPGLDLALPSSSSHSWFDVYSPSDHASLSSDPRPRLSPSGFTCATTGIDATLYATPFPPLSSDHSFDSSSSTQSPTSPQSSDLVLPSSSTRWEIANVRTTRATDRAKPYKKASAAVRRAKRQTIGTPITVMNLPEDQRTRMLKRKILCKQKKPNDTYWARIAAITQQYNQLVAQGAVVHPPSTPHGDLGLPPGTLYVVDDEKDCTYCGYVRVTRPMEHFLTHVWAELWGAKVASPFTAILLDPADRGLALEYLSYFQCKQPKLSGLESEDECSEDELECSEDSAEGPKVKLCGRVFTRIDSLRRHLAHAHFMSQSQAQEVTDPGFPISAEIFLEKLGFNFSPRLKKK